jgi:5-methylcytosine-specific restriction endonuclease McrA
MYFTQEKPTERCQEDQLETMTPLLPSPDYYLNNLIAMTSSEAKRLWRRSIKEHFNSTCVYCGQTYDSNVLTLDHVHPRSRGGQDITSNVVCACRNCNQAKGSRNWLQWMRSTFGTCPLREKLILSHIN